MSRTITLAEFVRDLKRDSSLWVKTLEEAPNEFDWQAGYGAFSVSPSHVGPLVNYIETHEEHHRTESFQDELRRLLANYDVEYDEQYVWD